MSVQTIGEKNKELWIELDRRAAEIAALKRQLAEAIKERDTAYEKGVEDSAEVAFAYTDDMKGAEIIRDAIRALKGEGR